MNELKEVITSCYYLLGFLEAKHENSYKILRKNKDFKETHEYKSLIHIIDYLNSVLRND